MTLESGAFGRAAVPSGASTGAHEAVELRDGDKKRYGGKGVLQGGRRGQWRDFRRARRASRPATSCGIDRTMIAARRHAEQGAARRQCHPRRLPGGGQGRGDGGWPAALSLCRRRRCARSLPVPMMNIVNGGAHADNPIDFQEFMIMPVGAPSFAEALRWGAEVFHALKHAAQGCRPQHQCRR